MRRDFIRFSRSANLRPGALHASFRRMEEVERSWDSRAGPAAPNPIALIDKAATPSQYSSVLGGHNDDFASHLSPRRPPGGGDVRSVPRVLRLRGRAEFAVRRSRSR